MTTPRPYLWQSLQLRAAAADGVGGIAHYFTEEAQSLYLHDGICSKELYVESGHWQDLTAGDEVDFDTDEYNQMSWTHPATGALYGTVIKADETDSLYLLRYTYAKDVGKLVSSSSWRAQIDNPINQFSATIKNWDTDAIIKSASLFCPGARVQVGLTMGDSEICPLGTVYLDEVSFEYNADSVSISGRNKTGFLLNDQSFNAKGIQTGKVHEVCKWVLDYFGVTGYVIQETNESITIEYDASDTGLKTLQSICDKVSGYTDGTDWDIEERYDGLIVIGFNAFRASYNPKSVFKFNGRNVLIKRASRKNIDGAYSKVYCTGRDSNNNDLTPVIANVTTWAHWDVVANKTYFAPTLEGVTQAELARYAQVLVKQLKRTGLNESYNTTIKPQLLVGDYATVQEGETETDIGIITQVTHNMGEKGFYTDFVADSGGDKKTLLSRAVGSTEQVYTSTRRNNGDNRQKRLMDYIKGATKKVIRTSGGSGGGTVTDVKVDGQSVVNPQTGEANITMPEPPTVPVEDVLVNGESVVDANKNAQIKSYKEVTQSEYNALPDSKLNDGILYAIKDVGGSDGFPPLIYSKEEREVGVWYDGRPLYMKTIEATAAQVTAGVYTDTDFTNLGAGFIVAGYYDCVNVKVGLNQYENTSTYTRTGFRGPNHVTYPNSLYLINLGYNNNGAVVTVCYTKTTDTPGSGAWTTQGAIAHHYSTDEHIIGTWIDGKPLYEKTFDLGSGGMAVSSSFTDSVIPSGDIETIVSVVNACDLNSGGTIFWGGIAAYLPTNANYVKLATDRNSGTSTIRYITLQYTKTTD